MPLNQARFVCNVLVQEFYITFPSLFLFKSLQKQEKIKQSDEWCSAHWSERWVFCSWSPFRTHIKGHPLTGSSVFLSHKPTRKRFTNNNQSCGSVAPSPLTTNPQSPSTKQKEAQVSQATFTRAVLDDTWNWQQHHLYSSAWKWGLCSGRYWWRPCYHFVSHSCSWKLADWCGVHPCSKCTSVCSLVLERQGGTNLAWI